MKRRSLYQSIEQRRWADISSTWLSYIPPLEMVGNPPTQTLSDLFALSGMKFECPRQRAVVRRSREVALTEAIFLFQKCIHVARSVEASAANGMLSWAVFQGYHSAYYAAKGVLALLGVCFPQPNGQQLLIDLFPIQPRRPAQVRRRMQGADEEPEVLIVKCQQLEQKLLWGFFGRILRVTTFAPEVRKHIEFLGSINHESISRPRNRFIYRENHWPHCDLTDLKEVADFAFKDTFDAELISVDEDHPSFLAVLGMIVPSLFRRMFDELGQAAPAIAPHITYMDSNDWQAGTRMVRSYF